MDQHRIRPLALCVFRHAGHILALEGYDPLKRQHFYRPLGGGIEFGEYAAQAVAREIREELHAEVTAVRYLGTLENLFTFNGTSGHEIVMIFDGEFVDHSLYDSPYVDGAEDGGAPFRAKWCLLEDFRGGNGNGTPPLYPDGLYDLLKSMP